MMSGTIRRALAARLSARILGLGLATIAAAAKPSGVHRTVLADWIEGRRLPRPVLFHKVLHRLGIPSGEFQDLVPLPVVCAFEGCGRPIGNSAVARRRKRRQPTDTMMHRQCRRKAQEESLRQVRCFTCPNTLWLPSRRIRQSKWTEERSGALYRHCGNCSRRQRAEVSRLFSATLRKHGKGIFSSARLLEARKASSSCPICADLVVARDEILEGSAKMVRTAVTRAVEIGSESTLQALRPTQAARTHALVAKYRKRREDVLSAAKTRHAKEIVEEHRRHEALILELRSRLRTRLMEITPKAGGRRGRRSWNKASRRPKLAMAQVVTGDLRPLFGPCALPECSLVLYRVEVSRPGPTALFHPQCWRLFKTNRGYRRWRGQRARGKPVTISLPRLVTRPGRPPLIEDPDLLLSAYQLLIRTAAPRSLGGNSQSRIAIELGISQQAVAKRISALIEVLPGSWDFVFPVKGYRNSNKIRQALIPLPAHRADRSGLAVSLLEAGMPPDDVAALVGIPPSSIRHLSSEQGETA